VKNGASNVDPAPVRVPGLALNVATGAAEVVVVVLVQAARASRMIVAAAARRGRRPGWLCSELGR
jgi:hypothetical protein